MKILLRQVAFVYSKSLSNKQDCFIDYITPINSLSLKINYQICSRKHCCANIEDLKKKKLIGNYILFNKRLYEGITFYKALKCYINIKSEDLFK